ncbi:MAG: Carbon monoxide dehydrogenase large chain [Pseudomonadota bacterium]
MGASDFSKLPHAGNYTDDIRLDNMTHAVFVRSPHAHANIKSINKAAALAAPGVVAVLDGPDVVDAKINGLPCGWLITDTSGKPMNEPPHPILANGKVRYVGDHVAMVVAETLEQAKNAAELVEVEYDVLPAVVDVRQAKTGTALHAEAPNNHCYNWAIGDKAAVDAAFAGAAHVTKLDLINNRLAPNPMEPRAAIGSYNRASDEYTLYVSNQNPHVERLLMTAFVLGLPEHKVRVIAPDVGGGFGAKIYLYAEDVCLTWASKKLNRNIKWNCDRSEAFLSDAHGRDHSSHAELAIDKDGKFLALRVHTDANLGAYLSTFSTAVPTILYATLLAGQYATPQVYVEVDAWFTNTAPVDAYRGAGRPEATYLLERIVSRAAFELGMTQDAIRSKNFITQFPYQTPVALQYDTGDFHALMNHANKLGDLAGFPARKAASAAKGMLRGIGYSSYIEACGLAPSNVAGALGARAGLFECGEVRVHPTGSVTVFTGSHSHGQGHETTTSTLFTATQAVYLSAWAPTAHVLFLWVAPRSCALSTKLKPRPRKLQLTSWKPAMPTLTLPTANSASRAPTRRFHLALLHSQRMFRTTTRWTSWNQASTKLRSTTPPTSHSQLARTFAKLKLTHKQASPKSTSSRQWTTSAPSSTP